LFSLYSQRLISPPLVFIKRRVNGDLVAPSEPVGGRGMLEEEEREENSSPLKGHFLVRLISVEIVQF
jgi:hypothetical protein